MEYFEEHRRTPKAVGVAVAIRGQVDVLGPLDRNAVVPVHDDECGVLVRVVGDLDPSLMAPGLAQGRGYLVVASHEGMDVLPAFPAHPGIACGLNGEAHFLDHQLIVVLDRKTSYLERPAGLVKVAVYIHDPRLYQEVISLVKCRWWRKPWAMEVA